MGFIPQWAVGVAFIVFAGALAQIVIVKLRASVRSLPTSAGEIDELRQALELTTSRLGEVEERLDFAERLLARHADVDRLAPPPESGS